MSSPATKQTRLSTKEVSRHLLEMREPQHARKAVVRVNSPAASSAQDTMENWCQAEARCRCSVMRREAPAVVSSKPSSITTRFTEHTLPLSRE